MWWGSYLLYEHANSCAILLGHDLISFLHFIRSSFGSQIFVALTLLIISALIMQIHIEHLPSQSIAFLLKQIKLTLI